MVLCRNQQEDYHCLLNIFKHVVNTAQVLSKMQQQLETLENPENLVEAV